MMECTTLKPGCQCDFMSAKGCKFPGGVCGQIVEKCEGCGRIVEIDDKRYCSVYPMPDAKWRRGICNFATHAKVEIPKDETGKKINPLKAAKRAARGH